MANPGPLRSGAAASAVTRLQPVNRAATMRSSHRRDGAERMAVTDRPDAELVRRLAWTPTEESRQALTWKEWLVTNGLGGYATGTVSGSLTRRYHGLLVAALPAPFGRTVMLNHLWERLRFPDGRIVSLPRVTDADDG